MRVKNSLGQTIFVYLMTAVYLVAASPKSWAIDLDQSFTGPSSAESEFFNINRDKRMMIQVNFVNGVQKPGIHHVPDNLNLLEAISLAGGVQPDSDPDKVLIKRKNKEKFETLEYSLTDLVADRNERFPELRNNDTIVIEGKSHIAEKTVLGLSIAASIVAIVSGYMIITKKR